jgi:hypothetical protein
MVLNVNVLDEDELLKTKLFVLEVDESEHRYYTPECELSRLQEIQD